MPLVALFVVHPYHQLLHVALVGDEPIWVSLSPVPIFVAAHSESERECVCGCVRACVRAYVRACVRVAAAVNDAGRKAGVSYWKHRKRILTQTSCSRT